MKLDTFTSRASDFELAPVRDARGSEDIGLKLIRGFVLVCLALPAFAQYAGPAILSRGEAPAAMSQPTVDFVFSLAVTGLYTTGLAGVSAPNAQGQLADKSSYGLGATLGVSGAHSWKHTHLGLDYSGSFSDYFNASYFAGLSQGLSLGLTHQFTRHMVFTLRESAGIFTQFVPANVALSSSVPFDPSQSYIPNTDFYNNRTIYDTTQASLTIQKSTRLSFDFGGSFFTDIRRSAALYGASGIVGTADVQYRVSRRATIGAMYGYDRFSYTHSIGEAAVQSGAISASFRMNRWTELSLFGGASHANSSFQQTVPIDPAILAILCPPTLVTACPLTAATVVSNSSFWGPNFGARISRSFRRGVVYANAGEGITPGNGLFLTSRTLSASAGYGYSGIRKWSLGIGAGYSRADSLGNIQGNYGDIYGSYNMSRQIAGKLSFVSSFNATQYRSGSFSGYNRLIYSASAGLGWSSKAIPVRFF